MTPYTEKHSWRPAQINDPYGIEIHLSQKQSQHKKLVPFASLLAISGTFNSLSKVLFIFPSRYLFAIGLRPIFSFRRKLPPILHTTSKVRDSKRLRRMGRVFHVYGILTLYDAFFQKDLRRSTSWKRISRLQFKNRSSRLAFWAHPGSVALTNGIIFIFFSSTYLYA